MTKRLTVPSLLTQNMIAAFLLLMVLLLSAAVSPATAQTEFTPVFHPELQITRTASAIVIDGLIDDPGWQGAAAAGHFHEIEPADNIKPPVETTVFATYSESHLYLSAICYDNPADIRATLSPRDRLNGDNIGFFIDTYGDATWAYTRGGPEKMDTRLSVFL